MSDPPLPSPDHAGLPDPRLVRAAQQIRELYDRAPIGYMALDPEGAIYQTNDTVLAWLGYAREDVVGKRAFVDLLTPESREAFKRVHGRIKRRETTHDLEFDMVCRDGRVMTVLVNARSLRDADGRHVAARISVIDITPRKLAQERAHLFEAVVENMNVGLHVYRLEDAADDRSLRLIALNPAAASILGISGSELIGRRIDEAFPGARALGLPRVFAEVVRTGERHELPEVVSGDDRFATHILAAKVFPLPRQCVGIIFEDISTRKRSEAALRESEERFKRAIAYAPIGLALMGMDGRFTSANPAMCRLVGYDEAELLAMRPLALAHPEEPPEDKDLLASLLAGNIDHYETEKRLVRKDGQVIWTQMTRAVLPDAEGRPWAVITQVQDITERRRLEHMRDEFTAMVGHELRTPMTSIRGSLGLLASGLLGPLSNDAREMVQIAVQSTDRLVRLVNDFLEIERMKAGAAPLECQRCDAGELVNEAVEAMRGLAADRGVTLSLDAPPIDLIADPDRLIQVLTNLISNAIKFSPAGGRVAITVRGGEAGVCFAVRDQGRGIPPDQLEAIFERFHQVKPADARVHGGTGLGLAICRGIVQQHGGRIWAENAPDGGAVLQFVIPRPASP